MSDWIRVGERLPEDAVYVLIHAPGWFDPVDTAFIYRGRWQDELTVFPDGTVTHWQPKPAPPGDPSQNLPT